MTMIVGFIGVSLGIFINVPQIIKSYKSKSVEGISPYVYILLFFTVLCFFVRAIAIKSPVFMISNGINIFTSATMILFFIKYKKKKAKK